MVPNPKDWRWSSYRATVGREVAPSFLTTGWILVPTCISPRISC
jgi:hypothetical protein